MASSTPPPAKDSPDSTLDAKDFPPREPSSPVADSGGDSAVAAISAMTAARAEREKDRRGAREEGEGGGDRRDETVEREGEGCRGKEGVGGCVRVTGGGVAAAFAFALSQGASVARGDLAQVAVGGKMERVVVGVVGGWSLSHLGRKQSPAGAQGSQVPRGDGGWRRVDESRFRREICPETQAEVAHRGGGGGGGGKAAAAVRVTQDVSADVLAFAASARARASARSNLATRPGARVPAAGGGSPVAHGGGGGGDGDGGGVSRARFAATRVAGWRSRGLDSARPETVRRAATGGYLPRRNNSRSERAPRERRRWRRRRRFTRARRTTEAAAAAAAAVDRPRGWGSGQSRGRG